MTATARVRVRLPDQLRRLARLESEVMVEVPGEVTQRSLLDAMERQYPALRGTIRNHEGARRPKVRIYACGEDFSHAPPDDRLPSVIASGEEPLIVLGAISGG